MTEHKLLEEATPGGMDSAEFMERVDVALVAMLRALEADAPENQFDNS